MDLERFLDDLKAAEKDGAQALREVVGQSVAEPAQALNMVGEPKEAGLHRLYHSDTLTVLNVVWAPYMTLFPHNHGGISAIIGVYTGREDNIFWRRKKDSPTEIEAAGAEALCEGDMAPLGKDIIHSVTNPIPRLTGAIHVYTGDFFKPGRSEWDPESLEERAYDADRANAHFVEMNRRFS